MELKTRIDLINFCIKLFGYKKYLELGVNKGECFDSINAEYKIGVDYNEGCSRNISAMSTDEFFKQNKEKFSCIFIDANHTYKQAGRDVENSIKCLEDNNSIILCHDCNPPTKDYESDLNIKCGNFWKYFVYLRTKENLDCAVADFDYGVGIIRQKKNSDLLSLDREYSELNYSDLEKNRIRWLRLMNNKQIIEWLLP